MQHPRLIVSVDWCWNSSAVKRASLPQFWPRCALSRAPYRALVCPALMPLSLCVCGAQLESGNAALAKEVDSMDREAQTIGSEARASAVRLQAAAERGEAFVREHAQDS